jgi:hypothetical protein
VEVTKPGLLTCTTGDEKMAFEEANKSGLYSCGTGDQKIMSFERATKSGLLSCAIVGTMTTKNELLGSAIADKKMDALAADTKKSACFTRNGKLLD